MFICEVTGLISQPGAKCHKIVVETRSKVYIERRKQEESREWIDVEVARGSEIVREISATEEGVKKWDALSDEFKKTLLKTGIRQRVHLHH